MDITRNVIYHGHVLYVLRQMPADTFNCVVTSPPYWVTRLYKGLTPQVWGGDPHCQHEWSDVIRPQQRGSRGVSGWERPSRTASVGLDQNLTHSCTKCSAWFGDLGNEPFISQYVEHIAMVFDEVLRVLRPDGTLWLNIGNTFYGSGSGSGGKQGYLFGELASWDTTRGYSMHNGELPRKCMADIPFRVVLELVNRGWIHRATVIWHKPNALPESVDDRPTVDFDYLFMLTKSENYYYEQQFEPVQGDTIRRASTRKGLPKVGGNKYTTLDAPYSRKYSGKPVVPRAVRNLRSVWSIPTFQSSGGHYAVFPPLLIQKPIEASCPKGGLVLDPFMGTGTTALMSRALGRDWVGIELSKKYVEMAYRRLTQE